eukprot:TRINITY_DN34400_c0_g1_i1.p2 TRINITY_DN34400_c0_g1~~TRINITY_DN34400_c0_g1_i1.p2  ORF type:complete len:280 (+),score=49.89 TRINITY_DN34400_c0_g1_i1:63-842(+)
MLRLARVLRGRSRRAAQASYEAEGFLSGSAALASPQSIRPKTRPRAGKVGEAPRLDYLDAMEESYGPKSSWHRGEPAFLRRVLPVLARKVDDLRERLADVHRHQRLFETATAEELRKIPQLQQERMGAGAWQRDLLIGDLKAAGIAGPDGALIDPAAARALGPGPAPPAPRESAEQSVGRAEEGAASPQRAADHAAAGAGPAAHAAAEPPPAAPDPRGPPSGAAVSDEDGEDDLGAAPRGSDPLTAELHSRRRRRRGPR